MLKATDLSSRPCDAAIETAQPVDQVADTYQRGRDRARWPREPSTTNPLHRPTGQRLVPMYLLLFGLTMPEAAGISLLVISVLTVPTTADTRHPGLRRLRRARMPRPPATLTQRVIGHCARPAPSSAAPAPGPGVRRRRRTLRGCRPVFQRRSPGGLRPNAREIESATLRERTSERTTTEQKEHNVTIKDTGPEPQSFNLEQQTVENFNYRTTSPARYM